MIKNFKNKNENVIDQHTELLLKILNKTFIVPKNNKDKELLKDENCKINSKNWNNIIPLDNTNLKNFIRNISR